MKYDDCKITESVSFPNEKITRKPFTKKKKAGVLDLLIVQTIICIGISCGVMISRIIQMGL